MECMKCCAVIPNGSLYCMYCGKKQVIRQTAKPLKRANGQGTIYKLSGRRKKPWVAALNKNIICCAATRAEAQEALEEIVKRGIPMGFNDTLEEVYERWKDSHFRDLGEKGKEGYLNAWRRMEPIKEIRMRDIKTIDFQRIVDTAYKKSSDPAAAKPLSRSGKEKIKQLASQLCKQAMQEELINRNYGEYIKLDQEIKKEKNIFSREDIQKLFAADDQQSAQIILVLLYSGMRINELFQMLQKNVYLDEHYMIGGEKTEAGRNRIIPIHDKIFPYIKNWLETPGKYLISNRSGAPIDLNNFRTRDYYPLLESLGIERKNPHCTRHTFASMMAKSGARPEMLQKILGHANYSTTAEIYVHADFEDLKQEVNII